MGVQSLREMIQVQCIAQCVLHSEHTGLVDVIIIITQMLVLHHCPSPNPTLYSASSKMTCFRQEQAF